MEPPVKGTVTPLASMFSEEEARKAAAYVEEKIGEKRDEMNRLKQFVDENENLISLVKKLPDQLHHKVMVPFGKLAFFPGQLIHTNEFKVLLGENYYTDRTSKQTVNILRRRDKTLQSQIHSIKAEIEDFQTEASFFSKTASEAAEGLVEIREELEEYSSANEPQSNEKEPSDLPRGETVEDKAEDDEFARIMSRLNELEMEEQEGEYGDDRDEEHDSTIESVEESKHNVVKDIRGETDIEVIPEKLPQKNLDDPLTCIGKKAQYLPKEDQSFGRIPQKNAGTWRDFQATSAVSSAMTKTNVVGQQKIKSPEPEFDGSKAFTGLIVEHTDNLQTNTHGQKQSSGSQRSKPVSRFKAQKR